jgi:hypothetical protein
MQNQLDDSSLGENDSVIFTSEKNKNERITFNLDVLLQQATTNVKGQESSPKKKSEKPNAIDNSPQVQTVPDTLSPQQIRKNRAKMTILHYIITYPQWSISLFLYFASLTAPIPTANDKFRKPIDSLLAVVQNEAILYYECVKSGFQYQELHLNRAALLEQDRVTKYRTNVVRPKIAQIATNTTKCVNATQSAQRALQVWNNTLGSSIPDTSGRNSTQYSACTSNDRQRLSDMLLQDLNFVRDNVQGIFDAYLQATLDSMHKLVRYSQERSAYDYNFFVGVKVQATLQLLDQFVAPNIYVTYPEQRIIVELRNILQDILNVLQGAYLHIDVLSTRLIDFEVSISTFYVNYVDLHGRFDLINRFVDDFLPIGFTLPSYFDVSGLPLPNTLLPINFSIPLLNGAFPKLDDLASEYVVKALQLIARILQDAALEATEQASQTISQVLAALREIMSLEDYDPPKYPQSEKIVSPTDEINQVATKAESSKSDLSAALDALNQRRFNLPDVVPVYPDRANYILDEKNQTNFSFLDLSYPEINIPIWILAVLGFVVSHSFLIEIVTQAIRLQRLRCKYEKNSSPDLPNIDFLVETEDSDNHEKSHVYKVQVAQSMFFKHVMNPWVLIGLTLSPCIIALLFCWFPHVKQSCISSRNGTFLARKIFKQILINKANSQGYGLHTAAQVQCFSRQSSLCNEQVIASDEAYRSDVAALYTLQTHFNESNDIHGIIHRCVETKMLDELFNTHCCGLEGYTSLTCLPEQRQEMCPIDTQAKPLASFRPVGELLLEPTCILDYPEASFVQESLFNCSVMETTCRHIPCTGVDENLIEYMTIEADCGVEIYGIQICIFLSLAVYHAIMINIMNKLFFNGMLQIRWKHFKPDGIKLITHINGDGQIVKGGDLQERADRVDLVMKRYVYAGYAQVGVSIVTLVFWLITFIVLKRAATHVNMYHN